jgi:hypothetical protein
MYSFGRLSPSVEDRCQLNTVRFYAGEKLTNTDISAAIVAPPSPNPPELSSCLLGHREPDAFLAIPEETNKVVPAQLTSQSGEDPCLTSPQPPSAHTWLSKTDVLAGSWPSTRLVCLAILRSASRQHTRRLSRDVTCRGMVR